MLKQPDKQEAINTCRCSSTTGCGNTHWSYLGPILAHCGIPRSRLPQLFRDVLPDAARIGVASPDDLAELQQRVPLMQVSRSIEWFIRFGDKVSADFVRRCVDMRPRTNPTR
jgi:hypothetical protein